MASCVTVSGASTLVVYLSKTDPVYVRAIGNDATIEVSWYIAI